MTTQLQLLASVNGGAYTHGFQTASPGQSLALQVNSTAGLQSILYELYDYPPGLAVPAGWSQDPVTKIIYFAPANVTTTPPVIALPAKGTQTYGPFMLRVRGNGNPLQLEADGTPNPQYSSLLFDDGTMVVIPGPYSGQQGVGIGLHQQIDSMRGYAGPLMQSLRSLEASVSVVNVVKFGADPTGSVDSLAAVNAALSALAGTGVALFIPSGTFSLSALPTHTTDAPRVIVSKDASFTGAGGTAFANLLGLETHFQGGTAPAAIKQCIPIKIVPADPNRGQYGLYLQAVENSDSTVDTTWHFGYNWDSTVASEPQAAFSIEDNWVTGGIPAVEMHIQCYLPVVGATVRPLSAYLRRDTGAISVTLEVNNGGIWEVLDHGTGKILMQASTSGGVIVGDNTYGSNTAIYGAALTNQSNDFRVFDEAGHERLQLCTGTSDLLKMGDAGAEFFSVTTATVACGAPLSGGIAGTPLQTASTSIGLGHGGTTTPTAAQTANPTLLLTDTGLTGNATVVLPTTTGPTEWTVDLTGVTFSSHTVTLEVGTNAKTVVVSAASVLRVYSDGVGKLSALTYT